MDCMAPTWVKVVAGICASIALAAISSFNIKSSATMLPQIFFAIGLAIIPFVPGWGVKTRWGLTIVFMLVNGLFAFENSFHRHDGERSARNQRQIWTAQLEEKSLSRRQLGVVKPTDEMQVEAAKKAVEIAERNKYGVKAAQDKLLEISALRAQAKEAEKLDAEINALNGKLAEKEIVTDTTSSEPMETKKAALFAFSIELGNRYIPEGIFRVLIFALPLLFPLKPSPEIETVPEALPPSPRKRRKPDGNGNWKSETAQVLPFRRRPTREELSDLVEKGLPDKAIGEIFHYSGRQIGNLRREMLGGDTRRSSKAAVA
jgi:hypothetical protein